MSTASPGLSSFGFTVLLARVHVIGVCGMMRTVIGATVAIGWPGVWEPLVGPAVITSCVLHESWLVFAHATDWIFEITPLVFSVGPVGVDVDCATARAGTSVTTAT